MRALRLSFFGPFMLNLGLLVIEQFYSGNAAGDLFNPDSSSIFLIYFSLALSALFAILPWYHINEALRPLRNKSNLRYDDVKHSFEVTYDNRLLTPFGDKQVLKNTDRHFLFNQVKRISNKSTINFEPFFNRFMKTAADLESGQKLVTCRRLLSNPLHTDQHI